MLYEVIIYSYNIYYVKLNNYPHIYTLEAIHGLLCSTLKVYGVKVLYSLVLTVETYLNLMSIYSSDIFIDTYSLCFPLT